MKKLALLLLAIPLAACATSSGTQSAANVPCVRGSHWETATGGTCRISAAGPSSGAPSMTKGPVYSRAGFGSEDWSPGYGRGDGR